MDNISWSFPIWATLLCLLPVLTFAILVTWRTKDFQAGLRLFFLLSAYIILLIFSTWLMVKYLPKTVLEILSTLFSGGIVAFICVSGFIYWINVTKAGKLLENGADPEIHRHKIFGLIFLGLAILGFLASEAETTGATVWASLFAGNLLGKAFLAFQIREHGIISRGRFIKFENIKSMQWVNLRNKEEVDIAFQNSDQIRRLKIPWKFIGPIDNYISAHFPRT